MVIIWLLYGYNDHKQICQQPLFPSSPLSRCAEDMAIPAMMAVVCRGQQILNTMKSSARKRIIFFKKEYPYKI